MAQFNPREFVVCGDRLQYYSYDGELYTETVPREWVENCKSGTGPRDCKECARYGSWNGVFIGYCTNCAVEYEYKRGLGFVYGDEFLDSDLKEGEEIVLGRRYLLLEDMEFVTAVDTYLKDINLDDIGDKDFNDSRVEKLEYDEEFRMLYSDGVGYGNYGYGVKVLTSEDYDKAAMNMAKEYVDYMMEKERYGEESAGREYYDPDFDYSKALDSAFKHYRSELANNVLEETEYDKAMEYDKAVDAAFEFYQAELAKDDHKEFPGIGYEY